MLLWSSTNSLGYPLCKIIEPILKSFNSWSFKKIEGFQKHNLGIVLSVIIKQGLNICLDFPTSITESSH